jgi:hypothetical protein
LAQSFEKANKSILVKIMIIENPSIISEEIEKQLLRYSHNKKKIIKQIIKHFKSKDPSNEFDNITEKLEKKIDSYTLFNDLQNFSPILKNDLNFYIQIKQQKKISDIDLEYIRQKFNQSYPYKYRIITHILVRYYHDIENNIRYPTEKNNFSMNNDFNNSKNRINLEKIASLNDEFLNIVNAILIKTLI